MEEGRQIPMQQRTWTIIFKKKQPGEAPLGGGGYVFTRILIGSTDRQRDVWQINKDTVDEIYLDTKL